MRTPRAVLALAVVFYSLFPRALEAQVTTTWTGDSDTNFFNAANWTAGVPGAGDNAIIDRFSGGPGTFNPTATAAPFNNISYEIKNDNVLTFDGGFNVITGFIILRGGPVGGKIVMAFDSANRQIRLQGNWTDEGGTLDQIQGSVRVDSGTRIITGAIITSGADLVTTAGSAVVTSASATFVASNVKAGQCLRLMGGLDKNWYRIVSVDSATQLTLDVPLRFSATGLSYEARAMPTFKHFKIDTGITARVAAGSCIRVTQPNTAGVGFNADTGFRYRGTFTLGAAATEEAAIMTESWGHEAGVFTANLGMIITTYSGDIPDDNIAAGAGTPLAINDIDMRLGAGDTSNSVNMPPADLTTCRTIHVRQSVTFNNSNGRLVQITGDWNNWGSYTGNVDAPDIVRFQGASLAHTLRGTTQFSRLEMTAGSGPTTLDVGADVSVARTFVHSHTLNGGSPATFTFLTGSEWNPVGTFVSQTGRVIWKKHGADAVPQALPASNAYYNLRIDTTGTVTPAAGLTIGNDFDILAGTFAASTFTHTISGDLLLSGSFTPGTSTIIMGGADSEILKSPSSAGSIAFNNLTVGNSFGDKTLLSFGKTVTVNAAFTIAASSTLEGGTSTVFNTTTWTNDGTFTAQTSTVVWDPAASAAVPRFPSGAPTAHESFYHLTIAGPATVGFALLTVNGNLRIDTGGPINPGTPGSLAVGTNNVTVKGNIVHNVASGFSASGAGKLILSGTAQQQISGSAAMTVNILEINKTGAGTAGTVVLAFGLAGDDFTVSGTTTVIAGKLDLGATNDTMVASANVDIGDGAGTAATLVMSGGVTLKMAGGTILRIRTDGTIETSNTGSVPTITSTAAGTVFYAIRADGTVNVGAIKIFSLATTATNTNAADNHGFTLTTGGHFIAFDNVTWDTLQSSGTNDTYLRIFRNATSPALSYTFNGHKIDNAGSAAEVNVYFDRGGQVATLTYDASTGAMGGASGESFDRNEAGADPTPGSIIWNVMFVWTGALSTAWATGGNWDVGQVPGATDSATIPDVTNDPDISTNVAIKNLTVQALANLEIVGSWTLTINGTWTLNGTFTADTSTVVFGGTTSQTIPVATFYNLRVANTGGVNTPASPITVLNDFTIDSGVTLTAGSADVRVAGNWNNSGTFTPGSSIVRLNGSGAGTQVVTGVTNFFDLEFSGSRLKRIDSNIDVNGSVTLGASAPVSTTDLAFVEIRVAGNWNYAASATPGTFTGGLSTVIFDGATTQNISQPNAAPATFNNLKTEATGTILVLTGALTLTTDNNGGNANKGNVNIGPGTSFDFTSDTVNVGGNWTVNGTTTSALSTANFNASAAQSIQTASTFNNLTITNTSATAQVSVLGNLTVNGNLTVSDGVLHMGNGLTHTVANDVTVAAGAEWNLGASTITVGQLNATDGDISVSGTLRMAGTASARPILQITGLSGTYAETAPGTRPDLLVSGSFIASAVDQNQRPLIKSVFDTSAVQPFFGFNATGAATIDFNGVTFDATDRFGLVLANGVTVTNFDNVTFQNAAGGAGADFYITLTSWNAAGPDTSWTKVSFDSAAAKHVDASGATGSWFVTFVDFTSPYTTEGGRETDPGGSPGFIRWSRTLTWTGAQDANFNNNNNWSPQQTPTSTDKLIIPDVSVPPAFDPVVNADVTVFAVTIQTGGLLTMSNATMDLTVTGDFTIDLGGTLTQSAANVLSVGGVWTDNGTFTQTAGTVRFTGATARVMKGTFTTVEAVNGATLTVGDGTAAATMTVASTGTFTVGNGGNATLVLKNNSTLQTPSLAITGTDTFTAETGSTFRWMGATMPALTYYNVQIGDGAAAVSATLGTGTTTTCDLWIRAFSTLALGGQTVDVNCNLIIDGTLTGAAGGSVLLAGNFTLNGIYTAGTSSITFDGGVVQTVSGTAVAPFIFNAVTIAASSTVSLSKGVLTASLTTTAAGSVLKLNALQAEITGVWTDAAAAGNLAADTGTVFFNGTAQTIPNETWYHLRTGGGAAITYTLPAATTVNGNLTFDGGVISAGALGLTVRGNWVDNDAANDNFAEGTGTVTFAGTANQTITFAGTVEEFNNLVINNSGAGTTVAAASNVTAGPVTVSAGTLDLGGSTLSHSFGAVTVSAGTLDLNQAALTAASFSITGTVDATDPAGGALTVTGAVTINVGGTLSATGSSKTISVGGWTDNGTFSAGTTTVRVTATATVGGSPTPNFYNFSADAGAGTVTAGAGLAISNNLLVPSGTLAANGQTITVAGAATLTGTVTLATSGSVVDVEGNLTGGTLTFGAPATPGILRVAGNLTLGTLTAGNGTVVLDGGASTTLDTNGQTFNVLSVNKTSAAAVVTVTDLKTVTASTELEIVQGKLLLQRPAAATEHAVSGTLDIQTNGDLEIKSTAGLAPLQVNPTSVTIAGDVILGDNAEVQFAGTASITVNGLFQANPASMSARPNVTSTTPGTDRYTLSLQGTVSVNGLKLASMTGGGLIVGSATWPQTNLSAFDRVEFSLAATGVGTRYLDLVFTQNAAAEVYSKTLTQLSFGAPLPEKTIRALDGAGADNIDIFVSDPTGIVDETTFDEPTPAEVDLILIKKLVWRPANGTTTAWNDAENWDENGDGVGPGDGPNWPGSSATALDIEIPVIGTGNYPAINVVNTALARSVTVAGTTSIDLNGQRLEVAGGVANSGTLDVSLAGSKLLFTSGSAATATLGTLSATNNLQIEVNKTGGSVTAGSAFTIGSTLTMTAGTFSPNGFTISVTGLTTVNGGALDASAATGVLDLNGDVTVNAAGGVTFGASGVGTVRFGAGLTVTAADWLTPGNGTVVFDSAAAQTIPPETYFHLTINKSAGTATASGALDINGNFTLTAGTFDPSTFAHTVAGSWTSTGTFTATAGTVTFDGTGAVTIDTAAGNQFFNLTIGGPTATVAAGDNLVVAGNLAVNSPLTLNAAVGHSVTGTLTIAASQTLDMATAAMTVTGSATNNGTLKIDQAAASLTTGAFTTNTGGTINFGTAAATLTANGNYSNQGTITVGLGTIRVGGTSSVNSAPATGDFYKLVILGTVTASSALDIDNNLTINSGASLNLGGATLLHDVAGTTTVTGTLNVNNSELTARGNVTVTGTLQISGNATSGNQGELILADLVSMSLQGTLTTSFPVGGFRPKIRRIDATSRFGFTVGSGGILNVNGLEFRGADASGLQIAATASQTSQTLNQCQFFEVVSGGKHLWVRFTTGTFDKTFDGCTFDTTFNTSTGKNVVADATAGSTIVTFSNWAGAGGGPLYESQGANTDIRWLGNTVWTGAVSTAWSLPDNWDNGVPGAEMTATVEMPASLRNCIMDVNGSCANLTVRGSPNGNVTLNLAGFTLTVANSVNLEGAVQFGTIAMTAAGSTLQITGNWTNSGGTLNQTTGTIVFNGTGSVLKGETGFFNVQIADTKSAQIGDGLGATTVAIVAGGTFTIGPTGGATLTLKNAAVLQTPSLVAAAGDTFVAEAGSTFQWMGGAMPSIPDGPDAGADPDPYHHLVIGSAASLWETTTVNGNLTVLAGSSLAGGAQTARLKGNLVVDGSLTAGTSTYSFEGAVLQTVDGAGAVPFPFNNITVAASTTLSLLKNIQLAGDLTTTAAGSVLKLNAQQIEIRGTWSDDGAADNLAEDTGTVFFNNPATGAGVSIPAETYNHLRLGTGPLPDPDIETYLLLGPTTTSGNVVIDAATTLDVTASNFALAVKGNWTRSGTFVPQSGTVTFNGTGNQSILTNSNFNNLTINNTGAGTTVDLGTFTHTASGAVTVTAGTLDLNQSALTAGSLSITGTVDATDPLGGALTVTGSVTINAGGTLNATGSSKTINVGGSWTDNGTFNVGTTTVRFTGTATVSAAGTGDFYNLQVDAAALTVSAGTNLGVSNNLILTAGTFDVNNKTVLVTGNVSGAGTASIGTTSGAGLLNVRGNISSGAIVFAASGPGTATLRFGGATFSPTSLTNTQGTTIFDSTSAAQNVPAFTFFNLTIEKATQTATATGNLTLNGSLVVTSGTFDLDDATVRAHTVAGAVTVTEILRMDLASSISVTGLTTNNGTVSLGAGTYTSGGLYDNNGTTNVNTGLLDANAGFDSTGGTLDFNGSAGTAQLAGAVTFGILNESAGTIVFDGTAQTIPAETYWNLTTGSIVTTYTLGGAITAQRTLTVGTGSTLAMGTNNVTVGGNLITNGSFTQGGAAQTVTLNGAAASIEIKSNASAFNNLTISVAAASVVTLQDNATVNAALSVSSGELDLNPDGGTERTVTVTGATTAAGTLDINGGTLSAGGALSVSGTLRMQNGGTLQLGTGLSHAVSGTMTTTFTATRPLITRIGGAGTYAVTLSGTVNLNGARFEFYDAGGLKIDGAGVTLSSLSKVEFRSGVVGGTHLNLLFVADLAAGSFTYNLSDNSFDNTVFAGGVADNAPSATHGYVVLAPSTTLTALDANFSNTLDTAGVAIPTATLEANDWDQDNTGAVDVGLVNFLLTYKWNGSLSDDWTVVGNWDGPPAAAPVSTNGDVRNVIIPTAGVTFNPRIPVGVIGVARALTIESGRTLTLDATAGGFGTIQVQNNLDNAGTLTALVSGANRGRVVLNGSGAQLVQGAGAFTIQDLEVNKTGGTASPAVNLTVANALILTAGNFDTSTTTLTVNGPTTVTGTLLVGAGTLDLNGSLSTTGTINFQGLTGTLRYSGSATPTFGTLVEGNGTIVFDGSLQTIPAETYWNLTTGIVATTYALGGAVTVSQNLTIGTTSTLGAAGFNISLAGNWVNNGSFTHGGGTQAVTFNGSAAQSIAPGTSPFNNLTVSSTGTVTPSAGLTIAGNLSITSGTLALGAALSHSVSGTATLSGGTLDAATSSISITGALSNTGTIDLDQNAASLTCGSFTNNVGGTLTWGVSSTASMTCNGSWSDSGTTTPGNGTVTLNGAAMTVATPNSTDFYNLVVNGTRTATSALDIEGSVTINGTFTPGTFAHTVAGSWNDSPGTFVATAGTFTFDGAVQTITTDTGTGTNRFFNLVINSGSTASVAAGDDLEVAGNLTVNGTLTLNATLGHSVTGALSAPGTLNMSTAKLTVAGSTTIGGTLDMTATTSTNGELVANGGFSAAGTVTFGATAAGKITVTGNYSHTGTMTAGNSTVTVGGTGATIRADAAAGDFYNLTISGGTVSIHSASLNGLDIDNQLAVSAGTLTLGLLIHDIAGTTTITGTLTQSSSTVTYRGNVTVGGTMNLNSGAVARALNGVGFTINGAFNTSGATKPILQGITPGTDRFGFTVNSGATINIAGLDFNSPNGSGLTINAGATITDIDNVDFKNHAGAAGNRFLGVLFTSGTYTGGFNGCTFASVGSGYNVVVADNAGTTTINLTTWSGAGAGDAFELEAPGDKINWVADATWVGGANLGVDSNGNGILDEFDWNIGANWSTGAVPGDASNAIIPDVTYDPTLTVDATIAALTINDGGQLNMTTLNDLTVNGNVTLAGGVTGGRINLNNAGAILTVRGDFTDDHPTQGVTGTAGTIRLFANPGTVHIRTGVTVEIGNGTAATSITVPAAKELRVAASGSLTVLSSATLTLNGKIVFGNAVTFTVNSGATLAANSGSEIATPAPGTDRFNSVINGAANISGLTFRSAGPDGLSLQNANAISNLRNVTFTHMSPAAGAAHVTISGTALNLDAPGCFFDTVPAGGFNVKATDTNLGSDMFLRFEFRSAAENGTGAGEALDSDNDNTPQDGVSDGGGAVVGWIVAAGKVVTGSVQIGPASEPDATLAYPVAAIDLNTGVYYSTYLVTRDISGAATADRIWVLDQLGNFKSYSYDVPEANGNIVGTPFWYTIGTDHVLFFGTTTGYLYRLIDTGGALTNAAGWPFKPAAVDQVTSPMTIDDNNLYFGGLQGATPKMFAYAISSQTQVFARDTTTTVTTFPGINVVSSTVSQIFSGTNAAAGVARVWRLDSASALNDVQNTASKEHHIRNSVNLVGGFVYVADYGGRVHKIDATGGFTTNVWVYYDTTGNATSAHPASPGASPGPTGQAVYVMPYLDGGEVFFGDADGHVYRLTSAGALSWRVSPDGTFAIKSTPLIGGNGNLYIGNNNGRLFSLNPSSGATLSSWSFGTGLQVSDVAADNVAAGTIMVATSSGRIYYVPQ